MGLTPKEVQKAINGKRYKWTAKETPYSDWEPGIEDPSQLTGTSQPHVAVEPDAFNWRDKGKTTDIRDQGRCRCCVAFGVLGALESMLMIKYPDEFETPPDLSEAHLWACGRECGGPTIALVKCNYVARSSNVKCALEYLKMKGVSEEGCYPYPEPATEATTMKCTDTCSGWVPVPHTNILKYELFKPPLHPRIPDDIVAAVMKMKENIVENGPQVTVMKLYEDFVHYVSGVYIHVIGEYCGLHCVTVVGYDDNEVWGPADEFNGGKGCWICKNSYGKDWGEDGWFKIAYGAPGIEVDCGMWNIEI